MIPSVFPACRVRATLIMLFLFGGVFPALARDDRVESRGPRATDGCVTRQRPDQVILVGPQGALIDEDVLSFLRLTVSVDSPLALEAQLRSAALDAQEYPLDRVALLMASLRVVPEGSRTRVELADGDIVLQGGELHGIYEGEIRLANLVRYVGFAEPVDGGLRLGADSQYVVGRVGLTKAEVGHRPTELELFVRHGFGYTEGWLAARSGGRVILLDQGAGVAINVPSSSLRFDIRAGFGVNAANNGRITPGGMVQTTLTAVW